MHAPMRFAARAARVMSRSSVSRQQVAPQLMLIRCRRARRATQPVRAHATKTAQRGAQRYVTFTLR